MDLSIFSSRAHTLNAKVGAVTMTLGAFMTLAPIVAIVVGHLAVGIGAAIGVGSLLAATQGGAITDTGFVTLVERIFGIWAYVSAWMLWRGHIGAEREHKRAGA